MSPRTKPLRRRRPTKRRVAATCSVRGCKRSPEGVKPGGVTLDSTWYNLDPRCLTHAKREADRLFSLDVRSVGQCERCGKRDGLQCSHFISRRYLGTRWIRLNAECLCVGCHKFLTERPIEARDRARELLGATVYDELEEKARHFFGPVDYAAIIAELGGQPRRRAVRDEPLVVGPAMRKPRGTSD